MNKTILVKGYIRCSHLVTDVYGSTKNLNIFKENISYYFGDYTKRDDKPCIIIAMNNGTNILIKQSIDEFEKKLIEQSDKRNILFV